jgi:hypothetical protein
MCGIRMLLYQHIKSNLRVDYWNSLIISPNTLGITYKVNLEPFDDSIWSNPSSFCPMYVAMNPNSRTLIWTVWLNYSKQKVLPFSYCSEFVAQSLWLLFRTIFQLELDLLFIKRCRQTNAQVFMTGNVAGGTVIIWLLRWSSFNT